MQLDGCSLRCITIGSCQLTVTSKIVKRAGPVIAYKLRYIRNRPLPLPWPLTFRPLRQRMPADALDTFCLRRISGYASQTKLCPGRLPELLTSSRCACSYLSVAVHWVGNITRQSTLMGGVTLPEHSGQPWLTAVSSQCVCVRVCGCQLDIMRSSSPVNDAWSTSSPFSLFSVWIM